MTGGDDSLITVDSFTHCHNFDIAACHKLDSVTF